MRLLQREEARKEEDVVEPVAQKALESLYDYAYKARRWSVGLVTNIIIRLHSDTTLLKMRE